MRRRSPHEARFLKVSQLSAGARGINIVVKVLEIGEARTVYSRRDGREHRVADVLVGDETGVVLLSLWDDNIDKVQEGDVIEISNGYVSTFRNELRLNVGRYGSLRRSEREIPNINYSNNVSRRGR